MRFAQPEYFYLLLLLLPAWGVIYILYLRTRRVKLRKLGDPDQIRRLLPERSNLRRHAPHFLLLLSMILVIAMLARPQRGLKEQETEQEAVQIALVLDVSRSMLARDIAPSRIDKAKMLLSKLFNEWEDDQVAVIVFADEAYTLAPMTGDRNAAAMMLQSATSDIVSGQGTNISKAIERAMTAFTDKPEGIGKCIVLLTDGEDHEQNAVEAAKSANRAGIVLHAVSVGTPNGGTIPDRDNNTGVLTYEGQAVVTRPNVALMQQLAQEGRGVYAALDNSNAAYDALTAAVSEMQKAQVPRKTYEEWEELFPYIACAIIILLLPVLFLRIGFRKKHFIPALLLLFAMPSMAQNKDIRAGNILYKAQKYAAAEQMYRKALKSSPNNALALYNMGNAIVMQGRDRDGLEQGYAEALKYADTKALKAAIYHNMGDLFLAHQDYARAVEAFRHSLRNEPTNDETRYNLALAQKLLSDQNPQPQPDPQSDSASQDEQQQRIPPPDQNKLSDETTEQLLEAAERDEQRVRRQLQKPPQEAEDPRKKKW